MTSIIFLRSALKRGYDDTGINVLASNMVGVMLAFLHPVTVFLEADLPVAKY